MPEVIVHIVDDDEAVRDSLAFQLQTAGYQVREYGSAETFLDTDPGPGGVLITDVRMPGLNGLELVHRLNAKGFGLPIIMMTGHGDVPLAVEAMKAGVVDFLEKPLDDNILLTAVANALSRAGRPQDNAEILALKQRFDSLSPREWDVLKGVVAGKPNKVIAFDHGISPRTVEVYRANLMTKTAASSLSELVRMALTLGL